MLQDDQFIQYLQEQFNSSLLPALQSFIKIDNSSRLFDPDWKTNNKQLDVINHVVDWINELGLKNSQIQVLNEENRTPLLLIIFEANKVENPKNVFVYGHLDKQPPLTEKWSEGLNPYIPVIKDGRLYGRGSSDDGYAIFSYISIMQALQKFDLPYDRYVYIFETDEESGSQDIEYYLNNLKEQVQTPDYVICSDSGTINYEHICFTTSQRGIFNFTVEAKKNKSFDGCLFSGVQNDSYKAIRKAILDFEDVINGELPNDLYTQIPTQRLQEMQKLCNIYQDKPIFDIPLQNGVEGMTSNNQELLINNYWKPCLTLIGTGGIPSVNQSGDLMRKLTQFRLSIRLSPNLDPKIPEQLVRKYFDDKNVDGFQLSICDIDQGNGFNAQNIDQESFDLLGKVSQQIFNTDVMVIGTGGSIPFMGVLANLFEKTKFLITGACGNDSNIHNPDENLNLDYCLKYTQTMGLFMTALSQKK